MNKKMDRFPLCLAALLGAVMGACVVIRTFLPAAVLPKLDIPAMVLLTLIALLLAGAGDEHRARWSALWGAMGFGLIPAAAAMVAVAQCWKYALVGGIVVAVTAGLFGSLTDRLRSGPAAKAAPLVGALCLWLASQAFAGMVF